MATRTAGEGDTHPRPALPRAAWDRANRHPQATAWLVTLVGCIAYVAWTPPRQSVFDADYYFRLRLGFGGAGSFSPFEFQERLRGYSYPALLRLIDFLSGPAAADASATGRRISLVIVPLLVAVLVPSIARRVSPSARITVPRLVAFAATFCLLWRHELLYTLTDLPTVTALAGSFLLILVVVYDGRRAWRLVIAGALLGFAMNARPAFLLAVLVTLGFVALASRSWRPAAARVGVTLLGILIVLTPQAIISARQGAVSPLPADSSKLTLLQLSFGVTLNRYDTSASDGQVNYPNRAMSTLRCCGGANRTAGGFTSFGEYLSFVASHPFDVGSAYVRHLFNGLDARFGGSLLDGSGDSWLTPVVNFTLVTLGAALLIARWARRQGTDWRSPATGLTAVVAAAVLPGVTGGVETRFLIPLHLTLLAACFLGLQRSDLPDRRRLRVVAGAGVAAFVAIWFAISTATLDTATGGPRLADGSPAEPEVAPVDAPPTSPTGPPGTTGGTTAGTTPGTRPGR